MHIITFIAVLFVVSGMAFTSARKVFALRLLPLPSCFQRVGLFLWEQAPSRFDWFVPQEQTCRDQQLPAVFEGRHNKERSQSPQA